MFSIKDSSLVGRLGYNFLSLLEAKIITSKFERRNIFPPPTSSGRKGGVTSGLTRLEGACRTGNGTHTPDSASFHPAQL